MTNSAITTNVHQSLDTHLVFRAQFTLDLESIGNNLTNCAELIIIPFTDFNVFVDTCLFKNFNRAAAANSKNIGQGDFASFVIWYVYTNYSSHNLICLLYTSPSPRDGLLSRMPSSA